MSRICGSAGKRGNRIADSSGVRYRHRVLGGWLRNGSSPDSSLAPRAQTFRPTAETSSEQAASTPCSARSFNPTDVTTAGSLLLKPEAELQPEQRRYLEHLGRSCPEVLVAQQFVVAFLQLVRTRESEALEPWIEQARASGLRELVEFAKGLVRDYAAVKAALRHKWSNGMTEGHVNRLKMIKRTGYGRASFALRRQRVLAQV